jgi:hypothetical protein
MARRETCSHVWRSRRTFAAPDLEDRLDEVVLEDAESPALSSKTKPFKSSFGQILVGLGERRSKEGRGNEPASVPTAAERT